MVNDLEPKPVENFKATSNFTVRLREMPLNKPVSTFHLKSISEIDKEMLIDLISNILNVNDDDSIIMYTVKLEISAFKVG